MKYSRQGAFTLTLAVAGAAMIPLAGLGAKGNGAATTTVASEINAAAKTFVVDPVHSNIVFKIRHSGVSNFYGRFNDISGTINYDKGNVESTSMSFTVDTNSVDTNNRTRDGHIKGADFFNARQYPEASFTTKSIKKTGENTCTITGDFTFHGQTREITAELVDIDTGVARDKEVLGLEARFAINRSDYGITKYVDSADPEEGPLGDRVEIIVAVEAVPE